MEQPELLRQTKMVNLADVYPLLQEILSTGGSFSLTVTGTSMYPFILGGRDQVTLSPLPKKLKKNDLPLYRRVDGAFVLHRIVKVGKDGSYTMCGDHQWQLEKGIREGQMIALATAFVRKGRRFTDRNLIYRVYRTLWTWLFRFRHTLFVIDDWLRLRLSRFKKQK